MTCTMRQLRRAVASVVAAGALLAGVACSGGTADEEASAPTTSPPAGATTATTSDAAPTPQPHAPVVAPTGAAFYVPPDPLPDGRPGDLIWAAELTAPEGSRAWKVLYHSRAVDGHDIAVSGVVVAPTTHDPSSTRPVLAVGVGARGLADQCALSMSAEQLVTSPLVQGAVTRGLVFAATDYEGLGTPGRLPYGAGESAGHSVLDAARAATQLDGSGAGRRVVLQGHSQGSHAVLVAAALAPSYAAELDVVGVVAAAPMADVTTAVSYAAAAPQGLGFLLLFVLGLEAAYPEARASLVLTEEGLAQQAVVDQQCLDELVPLMAARQPSELVAQDPVDVPAWRAVLEENSLGAGQVDLPILVVQGDADVLLPKALADDYVARLCTAGDTVDYRVYAGADHVSVLPLSQPDVDSWVAQRLAGEPATSTC